MSTPLPAHRTKHLQTLNYPVPNTPHILTLTQTQSPCSASTGTTLWLSSQLLTYHLLAPFPRPHRPRGRAIGLGAGTGLTSHILSYLGFRVCATDLAQIVSTILSNNGGSERKLAGLYRRYVSHFHPRAGLDGATGLTCLPLGGWGRWGGGRGYRDGGHTLQTAPYTPAHSYY
ncbi:hypothetical protein C7212DRAFT_156224 [Tuber magnatum]|uniref:Uncharacterized protein n=1 Tax=Tuber magnatum TaxID=42249 RepID=A0A317SWX2_9PEZI|nr:hypothetical protein C7212DRAFT_156224 [Tuber magnatum]